MAEGDEVRGGSGEAVEVRCEAVARGRRHGVVGHRFEEGGPPSGLAPRGRGYAFGALVDDVPDGGEESARLAEVLRG
nr:hypothetical protein [Deltaproteobacteria bacterium]